MKKFLASLMVLVLCTVPAYAEIERKTKVSNNDTTAGFLNGKLVPGSNVTLVENNDGANETLTINASVTGSGVVLDLADNGSNESAGLSEIATVGDTNGVFSESSADKLLITLSNDWPKADTSDDLTCTNCIGTTEIDETTLESPLEALIDLQDLQGAVTDGQVPNNITIDLATTATTANAGDSATAFFTIGQIEKARGGTGTDTSAFGNSLFGTITDTFTDIDTESELESALGGLDVVAVSSNDISSANLATILTDESGTGVVAFTTSPVFTTPNIGSATGSITGNAGTATALAANGANAAAGNAILGVDASGAAEGAFDVATQVEFDAHTTATAAHGATGAVVGTTNTQTLTNKTLTAPIISTISNTGTLTLPTSTDTLVGRATTDTLTNKTLAVASNNITSTASRCARFDGSGNLSAHSSDCGAGGSGYSTIEDETTPLTQRSTLNFAGAGVSCADDAGTKTTCTIPGSGAATITVEEDNVSVSTVITDIDFGSGFDVTESPSGEANVVMDLSENVTGDVLFNTSNVSTIQDNSVDGTDIAFGSDAQGDTYYYDGTNVVRLPAGTSGQFLQTQGAGANPQWATASGSGDITRVGDCTTGDCFTAGGTGTSIDIGVTTGVRLSGATGVLTMASFGNTNNENMLFDLETTSNRLEMYSSTGVRTWQFQGYGGQATIFVSGNQGTPGAKTTTSSGNGLGTFGFRGFDSTVDRSAANLISVATENWSTTATGAKFIFRTTRNGLLNAGVDDMTLDQDGTLILGSGSSAVTSHSFAPTGATIHNEQGADADFRVESDNQTHAIFVDASADAVGFSISTPARAVHTTVERLEPQASVPASASSGDMYVDSSPTPDELCFYDGAAWQGISSGTDANCA